MVFTNRTDKDIVLFICCISIKRINEIRILET